MTSLFVSRRTVLMLSFTGFITAITGVAMADPITVKIEKKWAGSLPVKSLKLFPENQQKSRLAYVSGQKQWERQVDGQHFASPSGLLSPQKSTPLDRA